MHELVVNNNQLLSVTLWRDKAYAHKLGRVTRYWQNFRTLRLAKGLSQETVARRLGLTRQGNLAKLEKSAKIPKPATITRHARALECSTADLLHDVVTDKYDVLRGGSDLVRHGQVLHHEETTAGITRTPTPPEVSIAGSASPSPSRTFDDTALHELLELAAAAEQVTRNLTAYISDRFGQDTFTRGEDAVVGDQSPAHGDRVHRPHRQVAGQGRRKGRR